MSWVKFDEEKIFIFTLNYISDLIKLSFKNGKKKW